MKIVGVYSFNNGEQYITQKYPELLKEIGQVISHIDSETHKIKESKEKTMMGKLLFSPLLLNKTFKKEFYNLGWETQRVLCDYPTKYYVNDYKPQKLNKGSFREMDFLKNGLGVEVQFGKYSFMVYNVCAKMTIFQRLGYINCGVEIVPVKKFSLEMSSGVSYFEQFVWDLEQRGVSNIDIPVLIYGIDD